VTLSGPSWALWLAIGAASGGLNAVPPTLLTTNLLALAACTGTVVEPVIAGTTPAGVATVTVVGAWPTLAVFRNSPAVLPVMAATVVEALKVGY